MDFVNSEIYKKIFVFQSSSSNKIISRESGWLEFKEPFNWLSKDKYAKSMVAFANNKGGYIGLIQESNATLLARNANNATVDSHEKI